MEQKKSHNNILEEGLRRGDLEDCLYPMFEVDSFRSKMGEDKDVVVVTFQAKDRYPAKDFMEFIERGYPFVLDADVSAGENEKGEYSIFVEIERSSKVAENIMEMLYGLERLTNINDWKFSYYKDKKELNATTENLKKVVPDSAKVYEQAMQNFRTNEVKSFFNKTLMDNFTLEGDVITIYKPFDNVYKFKLIQEGDDKLIEEVNTTAGVGQEDIAEVFWLTKVFGDYDIEKHGDNLVFSNTNKTLILQRL